MNRIINFKVRRVENLTTELQQMWNEYRKDMSEYTADMELTPSLDSCTNAYVVYAQKDIVETEAVGFYILGEYPNSFSRNDIVVSQFFIKRQYRKKGIGQAVIEKCILKTAEKRGENVSLFVLKKNEGARKFWKKAMSRLGYVERFTEIGFWAGNDAIEMMFWHPEKNIF